MHVMRSINNPVIKPQDIKPSRPDFEVIGAFNAGVARLNDEIILLVRVAEKPANTKSTVYLSPVFDTEMNKVILKEFEIGKDGYDFSDSREIATPDGRYLTSLSHLRLARSSDGINFSVEEKPSLFPADKYEAYGIEDARITMIEGTFYISYSAISDLGIVAYLVSTTDFLTFNKKGVIFHPDNKDVAILPEKINGKYYALHRPSTSRFGKPEVWIAESPDLLCWGNHRHLMGTRENYWDDGRVGGGAIPFKVPGGWLEIYHGATKDNKYCMGAVLLDENKPWRVLARSSKPIMEPEAEYEIKGFFGNVVFSCGVLLEDDMVKIYYGAADTFVCYAEIALDDIMKSLEEI